MQIWLSPVGLALEVRVESRGNMEESPPSLSKSGALRPPALEAVIWLPRAGRCRPRDIFSYMNWLSSPLHIQSLEKVRYLAWTYYYLERLSGSPACSASPAPGPSSPWAHCSVSRHPEQARGSVCFPFLLPKILFTYLSERQRQR